MSKELDMMLLGKVVKIVTKNAIFEGKITLSDKEEFHVAHESGGDVISKETIKSITTPYEG